MHDRKAARPHPLSDADKERWDYIALIHRIQTGQWRSDADDRIGEFYHEDVLATLPDAEVSRNPKLSLDQQKSMAYDVEPEVAADTACGVADPQRVLEPRVVRPGKNEMRQSQLPDRGELLELARLEQRLECSLEGNCAMHGVMHHLGHGPRASGQL